MKFGWQMLILCFYVAAGWALFDKCLDNPFVMDDENQITLNPFIQDIQFWPSYFTGSTMGAGGPKHLSGVYYKPLMTSYYATIWHFFGSDPLAFRWPLLILHILNAWMITLIFSSFLSRSFSVIAGTLFLVHPMNTEIVAYIANAQDSLYLFFGLLSLLILNLSRLLNQRLTLFLISITLILSLLSKETGALFLVLTPLYAYLFYPVLFRKIMLSSLGIGVFYAGIRTYIGLTSFRNPTLKLHNVSILERWSTIPDLTWHYFYEYFWGLKSSLNRDYVILSIDLANFWGPLLILMMIALFVLGLAKTSASDRESKIIIFFSALLGTWFALHSHALIPLDGTVSDRWFYLGQIGALGILGIVASRMGRRSKLAEHAIHLVTLMLIALAIKQSWNRLELWSTPLKLYQADFARFPDDSIMANNIGVEMFRARDLKGAKPYFEQAILLNSKWAVPVNNLGAVEEGLGFRERAVDLYIKAMSIEPYGLAYENYARNICSVPELEAVCRTFLVEKALPLFPRNPKIVAIAKQLQIDIPK